MYQRILIPTDGSPCSEHTVNWGLQFAKALGAEVTFLHVLENPSLSLYALPGGALATTELMPELQKAGRTILERAQAQANGLAVAADSLMLEADHPAQAILRQETHYDLTIMGTHSRRGLDRLFLGSVTESVLRRSDKPHLVVRCPAEGAPSHDEALSFSRLLLPLDGSPCSDHAANEGLKLARALAAQVTFLYVLEMPLSIYTMPESLVYEPQLREDFKKAAQLALETAQRRAAELGVEATAELVDEPETRAVEAIVAGEAAFDLTVMGTHGRRGVNRALLGSVTEGVIRQSSIAHLVVRCPAQVV